MRTYGDLLILSCEILEDNGRLIGKNQMSAEWRQATELPPQLLSIRAALKVARSIAVTSITAIEFIYDASGNMEQMSFAPNSEETDLALADPFVDHFYRKLVELS